MVYPTRKNLAPSGLNWLGEVPENWGRKRLKFVVDIVPDRVELSVVDATYLGLEHIESWTGKANPSKETFAEGLAGRFLKDDVLFGKLRPYLAKVFLAEFDGVASTEALILRSRNEIFPAFLKYFLLSPLAIENINSSTYGSKMPRANWEFIGNQLQLIPPMHEQKKIAEFLDEKTAEIDELIEKKGLLLKLLAEKRSAIITQAVTKGLDPAAPMKDSGVDWLGEVPAHWDVNSLGHLTSKVGSGVTPSGGANSYVDEGVFFLRSQNIHFDGMRLDDAVFIDDETHASMSRTHVSKNDVLLNITGASIGRCCVFDLDEPANVNQHVCIIRLRKGYTPRFLNFVLSSEIGQMQIDISQNGSSREGLNFSDLKSFQIPMPDINGQIEIVSYLDEKVKKLRLTENKIQDAVNILKEYRSALITSAVTGQIEVTG